MHIKKKIMFGCLSILFPPYNEQTCFEVVIESAIEDQKRKVFSQKTFCTELLYPFKKREQNNFAG